MHAIASDSLRGRLRDRTADAHAALDVLLSDGFGDLDGYRAYVRGMHAFVRAATPAFEAGARALPDWTLPDWGPLLDRDLAALGIVPLHVDAAPVAGEAAAVGMLYVMEGSALGARVLVWCAQALGVTAQSGGAFLHGHADAPGRWRAFVRRLDNGWRGTGDDVQACDGALAAFALARACFRRALATHTGENA